MEDYKKWVVCGEAFCTSLHTMKGAEKTTPSLTEIPSLPKTHQRLPKRFLRWLVGVR